MASNSFKLDPKIGKALFDEIENSGVTRHEFDLKSLVARQPYIYGERGSEVRRAVQKLVGEARRKSDAGYLVFIGKFGANPGELLTKHLTEGKESKKKDKDEDSWDIEYSDGEDEDEDEAEGKKATKSDSSSSTHLTETSKKSTDKKPSISAKESSAPAPVANIEFERVSSPTKKMKANHTIETSTTEESFVSEDSALSNTDAVLKRIAWLQKKVNRGDGSLESPYLLFADLDKPETCGAGFEAAEVKQVTLGNYIHRVLHIRKTTTQGMEDEWSAYIPRNDYPTLASHAVMIRGPSQELWHRRPDLYHEEHFCDQTFLAHQSQQAEMAMDKKRLHSYCLMVFPEDIELENYIISHDSTHVKKGTREMTKSFEVENEEGKLVKEILYGMDVYWRIALTGGKLVTDPGSATKKPRKKKTVAKS